MPSERFQLSQCRIQNMVAHVELPVGPGGTLDIQEMYARLGLNCTYQRRMFPGLIYRPEASPVVLLCFYSGKIVITGGRTLGDIFEGWTRLWPIVRGFIKASPVDQIIPDTPAAQAIPDNPANQIIPDMPATQAIALDNLASDSRLNGTDAQTTLGDEATAS